MSHAQAAQQSNRDAAGRYQVQAHGEADVRLVETERVFLGTVPGHPGVNRYRIGVSAEEHPDAEWRDGHEAPTNDGHYSPAHDLEEMMPDIYDQPDIYRYGRDAAHDESLAVIADLKGRPDAPVTVYRAVPEAYADQPLRPGDWVSLSPSYAVQHGDSMDEEWAVVVVDVPAKHLFNEGYPTEFGYDPR